MSTPQLPGLFVAIDLPTAAAVETLYGLPEDNSLGVKIGQPNIYERGVDGFTEALGAKRVFVDVKAVDIGNTVAEGVKRIIDACDPDIITLYTAPPAIRAARKAIDDLGAPTKALGITVLTDWDDADCSAYFGRPTTCLDEVKRLGQLVVENGAHGIICSGLETTMMRELLGPDAIIGNPGIRWPGGDVGDQKRVVTPYQAILNGADFIVMGRPLLKPEDGLTTAVAIQRAQANIAQARRDRAAA